MKNNLLDLFYNFIVKEAMTGKVDCFMKYNILFSTRFIEDDISYMANSDNNNLLIPTLLIKNRLEFERLLLEYVDRALDFYDDSNFREEVREFRYWDNEKGVSKEKLIMTLLWSNATIEDFSDPCSFLRRRIAFFDLGTFSEYLESKIVATSEMLNSDIEVMVVKNRIEHETPYSMKIMLRDREGGNLSYEFPRIYFGMSDGKAEVYAIQNAKDRYVDENIKKIERKMYAVNENLDVHEDTFDNYGYGNLKDVTPSFLIAANVWMGLLKSKGIHKVNVLSMLVSRWNSKMIIMKQKELIVRLNGAINEELQESLNKYYEESVRIQSNLTEKFLRIFRRLGYHHSSIGIFNQPMELSSNLVLQIFDVEDICNNRLLGETYKIGELEKLHSRK